MSSSSLQLWHHQYLLCPLTWLAQLPQINVPGFALVTQHAGPAFLRNASVSVVFLDLLIWLTCTADLFFLHSKPCFCLHIGAVWPLTLTRELLVIYWIDQRASGKYRPTYSSLHTGVGVKFSWNIGNGNVCKDKKNTIKERANQSTLQSHAVSDVDGLVGPVSHTAPYSKIRLWWFQLLDTRHVICERTSR